MLDVTLTADSRWRRRFLTVQVKITPIPTFYTPNNSYYKFKFNFTGGPPAHIPPLRVQVRHRSSQAPAPRAPLCQAGDR